MSTLKVEVVKINNVEKHPNANRLDLVTIHGWQCVAQKDEFKTGELCLYIPIDSILPDSVESKIFGPDSKVKLHHSRVKTIKLRGAISQGLIVKPELLGILEYKEGKDYTSYLGITKYEPQVKGNSSGANQQKSKKKKNPNFKEYTGIENFKNYNELFKPDELVVITEKIHGTNARAGWVPFFAATIWQKIKKFLGLAPKWEYVFGSRTVQLQNKLFYSGYYDNNVYAKNYQALDLKNKLPKGYVLYGEIYGSGIQKNYSYGCNQNETKFVAFDLMIDGEYADWKTFYGFCIKYDIPMVPILYSGPFDLKKAQELTKGNSILCPTQKVREGVVVKSIVETKTHMGRKILKMISDDYLLKIDDTTEFH